MPQEARKRDGRHTEGGVLRFSIHVAKPNASEELLYLA